MTQLNALPTHATAPLSTLLSRLNDDPQQWLAIDNTHAQPQHQPLSVHTVGDFSQQVSQHIARFQNYQAKNVGLYFTDTYEFAVALFALAYAGKSPIVLPNKQPGFIESIQEHIDLVLTDQDLSDPIAVPSERFELLPPTNMNVGQDFRAMAPIEEMLTLFTSGSTGEPKRIVKSWQQLAQEVQTLEACWGSSLEKTHIASTVTHQHIYGLLFRLLWPLSTGRAFYTNTCHYPEQWLTLVKSDGKVSNHLALVTSPAHLKRAPDLQDLRTAQNHLSLVFSSGGPLPTNSALRVEKDTGCSVLEVLGSTETGGVAYRQQSKDQDLWKALPFVEVQSGSEQLRVRSPYTGRSDWCDMGDLVEFTPDQRFRLLGRSDRIAKIEEKRVSLRDLEKRLELHDWIDEAITVVLEGRRISIGAVVVLSAKGYQALAEKGRKQLIPVLKAHLDTAVEAVAVPRKWRLVYELPRNAQGKLTHADLMALFEPSAEAPKHPVVLSKVVLSKAVLSKDVTSKKDPQKENPPAANDSLTLTLQIPPNLFYFEGHFESMPIVPGVVQVHWAIEYAKPLFENAASGPHFEFSGIKVLKFHQFIPPGETLMLTLNLKEKGDQKTLYFTFENEEKGKFSSGRILGQSSSPQSTPSEQPKI